MLLNIIYKLFIFWLFFQDAFLIPFLFYNIYGGKFILQNYISNFYNIFYQRKTYYNLNYIKYKS